MNKYLIILSREQFNNFYVNSSLYLNNKNLITFDGDFTKNDEKILDFFKYSLPFREEDDYLLLEIDKEINKKSKNDTILINITDVVNIFAISENAKNYLEGRLDYRIKITDYLKSDLFNKILRQYKEFDIKKTVKAFWDLLSFNNDFNNYLEKLKIQNLIDAYYYRIEKAEIKSESNIERNLENLLRFLFAYVRNNRYPKTELGYFYDAGEIFAYFYGFKSFQKSQYYIFLETLKNNNINDLKDVLLEMRKENSQAEKFINNSKIDDINFSEIIPLFLMLKDNFIDAIESNKIDNSKLIKNKDIYLNLYGDSFFYTVILLSAFFDFKDIYSFYYEILDIKFFKDDVKKKKIEEVPLETSNKIQESEQEKQQDLITETQESESKKQVKKDKKGTKQVKKDKKGTEKNQIEQEQQEIDFGINSESTKTLENKTNESIENKEISKEVPSEPKTEEVVKNKNKTDIKEKPKKRKNKDDEIENIKGKKQ